MAQKAYTVTITERSENKEEKVFEFYSDDEIVLYTVDNDAYEEGKKLLEKSLEYMNQTKIDTTTN